MNQGIELPNPMAARQQQQAFLNQLRINIAVGIHKQLVGGHHCPPGDEWKQQVEGDGEKVEINTIRQAVAQEAVAHADALMGALGFRSAD